MIQMGERIKELRNIRGMTQAQLAEKTRMTQATVSRIEKGGVQEPGYKSLWYLADALGVSIDYLVGRIPNQTSADIFMYDPRAQEMFTLFKELPPEKQQSWLAFGRFLLEGRAPEEAAQDGR